MYNLKEILELNPHGNIRTHWMRFENTECSWYIRINVKTKKFQVTTSIVSSHKGSCWIPLSSEFKPYYRQTFWNGYHCKEQKSPVFGHNKKTQNHICKLVNDFIKSNQFV